MERLVDYRKAQFSRDVSRSQREPISDHLSMAISPFLDYTVHFYVWTRSMMEQERVQW